MIRSRFSRDRAWAPLLAAAIAVACSDDPPATERSPERCADGRDDDGDGHTDCNDPSCAILPLCLVSDAGPPPARVDGAICARPIDVVLTVDVSGSMIDELALLEDAAGDLVDGLRALDGDARVSLVVFADDAALVSGCSPLDVAGLEDAFRLWGARAPENLDPLSGAPNHDCPENSLDAIGLAITECPWRAGSARVVLHVTDDTFAERPTVLSGPYGGGVLVERTYVEIENALHAVGARLVAATRTGPGTSCGAGASADVGRGFSNPYAERPPLTESSRGAWIDLDGATAEGLASAVGDAAALACSD